MFSIFVPRLSTVLYAVTVFAAPFRERVEQDSALANSPQHDVVDVFYAHHAADETVDLSKALSNDKSKTSRLSQDLQWITAGLTQHPRSLPASHSEDYCLEDLCKVAELNGSLKDIVVTLADSVSFDGPKTSVSVRSSSTESGGPHRTKTLDRGTATKASTDALGQAGASGRAEKTKSSAGSRTKTIASASATTTANASEDCVKPASTLSPAATKTRSSTPAATTGGDGSTGENITIVIEVTLASAGKAHHHPTSSSSFSPSSSFVVSPPAAAATPSDASTTGVKAIMAKTIGVVVVLVLAIVLSIVSWRRRVRGHGEAGVWDLLRIVLFLCA